MNSPKLFRVGTVRCVGAVIKREGALLLVQRGRPPSTGLWTIPGGRVEPGESDAAAVTREVFEETGLIVTPGPFVGYIRIAPYDVYDYACTVTGGTLRPGDDASDARWVSYTDLPAMPLTPGLLETLTSWQVIHK